MGRAGGLRWRESWAKVVGLFRGLMEGRTEDVPRWNVDSIEKVILMWPSQGEASFAHLSRLYRYGFRLKPEGKFEGKPAQQGLSLYQFFADGEFYRPEAGSGKYKSLRVDLVAKGDGSAPLRLGQCRMGRAKPILEALGFSEFDTTESYAVQFAGVGGESWIFIDTRPAVFRREVSTAIAAKLAAKSTEVDQGPAS